MINLIFKDIVVQKKTVMYMLLYIVFAIFFMSGVGSDALYILITVTIAFTVSSGAFAIDEKYGSEKVMASLPVTRNQMVQARYLSVFIYAAASILIMSAIGAASGLLNIKFISLNYINLSVIKRILISCVLVTSISYPVYFKFGYTKARIASFIIFFGFFSAVVTIAENVNDGEVSSFTNFINSISSGNYQLVGGLILLLIFVVSYFISINCYENKEL
jgi:ABC-type transport system involved in multi-copper enzyme maturation permease subunit